jgi:transposase-like protein
MRCIGCSSTAVSERTERTAQGYRPFRCRGCGKQFNQHSASLMNRTQYPTDVIALAVLWRPRYKLSLRELSEMFLIHGIVFSHDRAVKQTDGRDWEAKLTPALAVGPRRRGRGKVGKSWYVDEIYTKVHEHWRYLYRTVEAAMAFFQSTKTVTGITPDRVTTDGHDSYSRAIRTTLGEAVKHRTSRCLNN